ncbi:MAG: Hsp20/alpha crystallin family protein [Desulfobulbaceae bacterium]|nr:Hsp20/alpha crystallin family protein [Desulfobulbaceae bacterium]
MSESTELVTRKEQAGELVHQLPIATPAVDIFENEGEILLHADMPGVMKDDVAINIDNGKMNLSGIRRLQLAGALTRREFTDAAEYRRTFSVPQSIDVNKVHAELKDGVLCLHLPKSEAAKPRQIEIQAE